MDATTSRPTPPLRLRVLGAGSAMALSGTAALIGALDLEALPLLALGGVIGVPVGGVMGWRQAPAIRRMTARAAFDRTLRIGALSVLLGALLVSALMVASAVGSISDLEGLVMLPVGWAFVLIVGLVVLGLPAFVLAFAVMWPWTFVIRHLPAGVAGDGAR